MPVRKLAPPVRSSIQPTRSAGVSLRRSAGPAPSPVPGFGGFFSGPGMSMSGSFIRLSLWRGEGVGSRRIDDVPDPARVLARIAGADRFELRRHAVARADLHLPVADARLEVIQGTYRRAADHLAPAVVHPAGAGADEISRRRDAAHPAPQVGATGREGDVWAG